MWARIRLAVVAWAITFALLAFATLLPKGLFHAAFLLLPMFSGLGALVFTFLGFCELMSPESDDPRPARPAAPETPTPSVPPRRAA